MKVFDIKILCSSCNQWHSFVGNTDEVILMLKDKGDKFRQVVLTDEVLAIESDLDRAEQEVAMEKYAASLMEVIKKVIK